MTDIPTTIASFYKVVMEYYHDNARSDLPWRHAEPDGSYNPYKILVSELMLQQTQVTRVVSKYIAFIAEFPDVQRLANAELADVLRAWQGLGYNRRAKYLWMAAKQIANEGWPDDLTSLPGVGVNTAGAIRAYAFNEPVVFIETNIRTVYIHHFAPDQQNVPDDFIRGLLKRTIQLVGEEAKEQPGQKSRLLPGALSKTKGLSQYRVFYWALMDYGTYLKTKVRNVSQSRHYRRQTAFKGSKRQLRGLVVRLLAKQALSLSSLQAEANDDRLGTVLLELEHEGLVIKRATYYELSK